MTSLLTSCHIQHVCWHYKSVYFTCHRQRSTKLSTTYAFWRVLDILRILCELGCPRLIWHNFVKVGDNWTKISNLAYIETCNRCVKNRLKFLSVLWKNEKNSDNLRGGIFIWLTLYNHSLHRRVIISNYRCETQVQTVQHARHHANLFLSRRSGVTFPGLICCRTVSNSHHPLFNESMKVMILVWPNDVERCITTPPNAALADTALFTVCACLWLSSSMIALITS